MKHFGRLAVALCFASALVVGVSGAKGATPAFADYGSGAQYQVEVSSNPGGFGFWLWSELGPGQTSDYQETDCIHLGGGSSTDGGFHDAGSLSGYSVSNDTVTMNGMKVIGGAALVNIAVSVPGGTNGYGQVSAITITVTQEAEPFFPLNVPLTFPATGVVAP
jgi:hypothetical protein